MSSGHNASADNSGNTRFDQLPHWLISEKLRPTNAAALAASRRSSRPAAPLEAMAKAKAWRGPKRRGIDVAFFEVKGVKGAAYGAVLGGGIVWVVDLGHSFRIYEDEHLPQHTLISSVPHPTSHLIRHARHRLGEMLHFFNITTYEKTVLESMIRVAGGYIDDLTKIERRRVSSPHTSSSSNRQTVGLTGMHPVEIVFNVYTRSFAYKGLIGDHMYQVVDDGFDDDFGNFVGDPEQRHADHDHSIVESVVGPSSWHLANHIRFRLKLMLSYGQIRRARDSYDKDEMDSNRNVIRAFIAMTDAQLAQYVRAAEGYGRSSGGSSSHQKTSRRPQTQGKK